MNSKKLLLLLTLILIAFVGLRSLVSPKLSPPTPIPTPAPSPAISHITLIIDYGNGQKSVHIREYSATDSAFTLLQQVTSEKQLPLIFKAYSFGDMVESINGIKNTKNAAWIYFVNSRSPEVGADKYQVRPEDLIEWKYIKPQ